MKEYICVHQYGGNKFVKGEFVDVAEAKIAMNKDLDKDQLRKGRGARLTVHIYRKFGSYANQC